MRAGRLRHRVTIKQKSVTRNTYGEEVITWADVATVWASIEPLRGREFVEFQREGAEVSTRITMRYKSGVVPEMRIYEGSHAFDILSVINRDERDIQLELMCREVV